MDRPRKLILLEGLPGSGKSTTGQRLQQHFPSARWVSEMQPEHPVYAFHDRASLNALLGDLAAGRHAEVIDRAIAKWTVFTQSAARSNEIQILDSCLFGYLTWTLYPHFDVPPTAVRDYVDRVASLLAPLGTSLIYFQQRDLAVALGSIRTARGGQMLDEYVLRALDSPFGRRRELAGFDGLVAYWRAWRELVDGLFERLPFAKLAVDTTDRDWASYDRAIGTFLSLPPLPPIPRLGPEQLTALAGTYVDPADGLTCRVAVEDDSLVAYDLPSAFPRNPLIPAGDGRFQVEAWAFEVEFAQGEMRVGAHEWGSRPRVFERRECL